jgi:hypothetical protein
MYLYAIGYFVEFATFIRLFVLHTLFFILCITINFEEVQNSILQNRKLG